MGGIPGNPRGYAGGAGGLNAPQQLRIQPTQPMHPLQTVQPVQPIGGMAAGEGLVSGNQQAQGIFGGQKTTSLPGAPTLPANPYPQLARRLLRWNGY